MIRGKLGKVLLSAGMFAGALIGTQAAASSSPAVTLSPEPAQRAASVSGEFLISGMEPQFVIVGQPTIVSIHGSAFSPGSQVHLSAGGFQVPATDVQLVAPELLTGSVILPAAAAGSVSVTVRSPDGDAATLPGAAQAYEVFWGLQTENGTITSGRLGSEQALWVGSLGELEPADRKPMSSTLDNAIADCQRISFCSIPSPGLGDFRPSLTSPNKCLGLTQEFPATNGITYFWCTSGPCTPSSPDLIKNKDVAVKVYPRYWTGGHCHSQADRPNGSPDSAEGNTGNSGLGFSVAHTWPDVAGAVNVVAYSTDPTWQFNTQRDTNYVFCIQEPGLFEMQPGNNYALVGQKAWHPFNHFAQMNVIEALKRLVQDVQTYLPSALPLRFNDMSLVSGGLLDISRNWSKPHCSHRNGMIVDLGIKQMATSPASRDYLEALCRKQGFSLAEEDSGGTNWHWHLTYKNPPKEKK